jgi:hypothetical protein
MDQNSFIGNANHTSKHTTAAATNNGKMPQLYTPSVSKYKMF